MASQTLARQTQDFKQHIFFANATFLIQHPAADESDSLLGIFYSSLYCCVLKTNKILHIELVVSAEEHLKYLFDHQLEVVTALGTDERLSMSHAKCKSIKIIGLKGLNQILNKHWLVLQRLEISVIIGWGFIDLIKVTVFI